MQETLFKTVEFCSKTLNQKHFLRFLWRGEGKCSHPSWLLAKSKSKFYSSALMNSQDFCTNTHSESKQLTNWAQRKVLTLNFSFLDVKHSQKHESKQFQWLCPLISSTTVLKRSRWAKSIEILLNESTRISDETISVESSQGSSFTLPATNFSHKFLFMRFSDTNKDDPVETCAWLIDWWNLCKVHI